MTPPCKVFLEPEDSRQRRARRRRLASKKLQGFLRIGRICLMLGRKFLVVPTYVRAGKWCSHTNSKYFFLHSVDAVPQPSKEENECCHPPESPFLIVRIQRSSLTSETSSSQTHAVFLVHVNPATGLIVLSLPPSLPPFVPPSLPSLSPEVFPHWFSPQAPFIRQTDHHVDHSDHADASLLFIRTSYIRSRSICRSSAEDPRLPPDHICYNRSRSRPFTVDPSLPFSHPSYRS